MKKRFVLAKKWSVLGAGAILIAVLMGLLLPTSIFADDNLIFGCANKNSGEVKVVDENDNCKKNWDKISWLSSQVQLDGDVTGLFDATVVGDDSHSHTDPTVADNISIDNGRLYAPALSGNVGIGTTSPAHALDVVGNIHASGSFIAGSTTTYGDGSIVLSSGTDLDIDSGTLFIDSANNRIGIGTTTPVSTFLGVSPSPTGNSTIRADVRGWINLPRDAGITANHPTQGGRPILWTDLNGTYVRNWDNNATDGIYFQSFYGTNRMFIREDGNVGIGTTSPSAKLDVNTPAGNVLVTSNVVSHGPALRLVTAAADGGQIEWRTTSARHWNIDQSTDQLRFFTEAAADSGGLVRMVITEGGSVGIGTTSPIGRFQVASDTGASALTGHGVTIDAGDVGDNPRIELRDTDGSGLTPYIDFSNDGSIDYDIRLRLTGNDSLAIEGGSVGIGTTTPATALDVNGTITGTGLTINGTVGGTGFSGWDTNASDDLTTSTNFSGDVTGTYNTMVVGDDSHNHGNSTVSDNISINNGLLYALSGGTGVGIGTTTPVSTFLGVSPSPTGNSTISADVRGWINLPRDAGITANHPTQGGRPILWTDLSGTYVRGWDNNGTDGIHFQSFNGTTRMFIREDGNVGIGTTAPSTQLHLKGGRLTIQPDNSGSDGILQFTNVGGTTKWHIYPHTSDTLRISNAAGTDRVVIEQSGDVGIGTDNPTERLHVVGRALATAHPTSSDARLKTNIQNITSPLDKVLALRGVTFNWKSDGSENIGLIAQEVEKVLPEVVTTGSDGYKSISYGNVVAVLVEAIEEQQAQIDDLSARLAALEAAQ